MEVKMLPMNPRFEKSRVNTMIPTMIEMQSIPVFFSSAAKPSVKSTPGTGWNRTLVASPFRGTSSVVPG
jgi:hypothetical protein